MSEAINLQDANKVKENVEQSNTRKKGRRGLATAVGASRKKFSESDCNSANGLFIGHLDDIKLSISTQKENSLLTSFAGLDVPSLTFTFASNHELLEDRRYINLRINPCESNASTIPGGKDEWKFNSPMAWLKHILDVFVLRGKPMTEEMEDKLTLPFEDFDENNEYVPVEPEVVLNGWRVLFENFISIMENNGKPYYKNDKGGLLPIWMKLLRYIQYKDKQTKEMHWMAVDSNNPGDLSFTTFVNEGAIELYHQAKAPNLRVDFIKESIIYKEVPAKAKKPNMPTIPGISNNIMGAMPIPTMPTDGGIQDFKPENMNYGSPVGSDDLPF